MPYSFVSSVQTSVRGRVTLRLAVYHQTVRLCAKPFETHDQFFFQLNPCGYSPYVNILSDKRMGLSFTTVDCPRQRSHSRVRVSQDSWQYFNLLGSRLPQRGGPGHRIYISQEHDGPVMPPGTGFSFHCVLWLSGLRWGIRTRLHKGCVQICVFCLSVYISLSHFLVPGTFHIYFMRGTEKPHSEVGVNILCAGHAWNRIIFHACILRAYYEFKMEVSRTVLITKIVPVLN
jgi:hypothetical protein